MGPLPIFLQQVASATATPQSVDLPTSVQAVIIGVLLYASRELPTRFITYLDLRIQEWKKRVDTLTEMGGQITKLFAEINTLYDRINDTEQRANQRVTDAESKAKADLDIQRKAHEEFISQVKDEFTRKMEAAVKEVAEGKDVVINNQTSIIQTLTTQLKEVTEERDQLRVENIQLKQKLKVSDTDEHPAVVAPPVLDNEPPIPPDDDLPSSTHLTPGVPGS